MNRIRVLGSIAIATASIVSLTGCSFGGDEQANIARKYLETIKSGEIVKAGNMLEEGAKDSFQIRDIIKYSSLFPTMGIDDIGDKYDDYISKTAQTWIKSYAVSTVTTKNKGGLPAATVTGSVEMMNYDYNTFIGAGDGFTRYSTSVGLQDDIDAKLEEEGGTAAIYGNKTKMKEYLSYTMDKTLATMAKYRDSGAFKEVNREFTMTMTKKKGAKTYTITSVKLE